MLHDNDKHTSKRCPFLACCVLQFFLLTIYKPLLYNIDEITEMMTLFSYFCSLYQSCVSVNEIQRHFCEMYKCMCRSN